MNASTLAGHSAPSANDQFLSVTTYVLDCFRNDAPRRSDVQLGDVLTFAQDGRITGFWRQV